MDNFKLANERLNITEVATWLGLNIKNHYTYCIYHKEKTRSLRLYQNTFYTFCCNRTGNAISLTSQVLGVTNFEALELLNDSFHLGLDIHKKPKAKTLETKVNERKEENYGLWKSKALIILSDYIKLSNDILYSDGYIDV